MAKRRMNDTAAVRSMPCDAPGADNESVSVSTRKIDNGYVTSTSRSSDGGYSYSESFSRSKPDIGAAGQAAQAPDRLTGSMQRAKDYLER